MSPEDQKKFDEYFDLFRQSGWKRMVEDLQESILDVDTVHGCDSMKEVGFRQGKLHAFSNIINLEEYMKVLFDEMYASDEEAV